MASSICAVVSGSRSRYSIVVLLILILAIAILKNFRNGRRKSEVTQLYIYSYRFRLVISPQILIRLFPGNHHAHPNWGYELGGSHMRRISQTYGPYSLKRDSEIPDGRPEPGKRLFVSQTVEGVINRVGSKIRDPGLAQIFANCLPSTLGL